MMEKSLLFVPPQKTAKLGWIAVCILVLGTLIYYFPRAQLQPLFDETGVITYVSALVQTDGATSAAGLIKKELGPIFYEPQNHQPILRPLQVLYRPLQVITVLYKVSQFYYFNYHPNVLTFINAFTAAAAAMCLFLLLVELVGNVWVALGASFLMLFSIPTLTGTWVVASGEHALVPLGVALTLLCYTQFRKTSSHARIGWGVSAALLCFMIPLYKEYGSVATFIIMANELLCFRKENKWFLLLMAIATFHAFFTSFLINAIFFHHWVFHSAANKAHVSLAEMIFRPELSAVPRFLFTIPPVISGLGLLGMIVKIKQRLAHARYCYTILLLVALVLMGGWVLNFLTISLPIIKFLPLLMLFTLFLAGFLIQPLLGLWAFLSWLPFLSTLNVDVYLLYAIAPMAAICLYYCRVLWCETHKIAWLRCLFMGLLVVAMLDQLLNEVAVYKIFQATNQAAVQIADAIAVTLPQRPVALISNTLLADDVRYFLADTHHIPLSYKGFTFTRAVSPAEDYSDPNKFFQFVKTHQATHDLFILDDFWPNSHSQTSRFLNQNKFEKKLITRYDSAATYPYLDPLKFFVPLQYINFPGSPDLASHMGLFNKPFRRTVEVNYVLYLAMTA